MPPRVYAYAITGIACIIVTATLMNMRVIVKFTSVSREYDGNLPVTTLAHPTYAVHELIKVDTNSQGGQESDTTGTLKSHGTLRLQPATINNTTPVTNVQKYTTSHIEKCNITIEHNLNNTSPNKFQTTITDEQNGVNPICHSRFNVFEPEKAMYEKYTQQSLYDGKRQYRDKIVILTPISNSKDHLENYFRLMCSLSYPHSLISIVLGEDSSLDDSLKHAQGLVSELGAWFRRIEVLHLEETLQGRLPAQRHDKKYQRERRVHLAHSRNQLLSYGLQDEEWVLWIDSDVKYIPPDIVQHLLSAESDIVAVSCMVVTPSGVIKIYDRNSWQETEASLDYLDKQGNDFLMLEGYGETKRKLLPDIKDQGILVNLDGVGGSTLLVRAKCHKMGLVFPPFLLDHHLETEGLAKMASKMNFAVKGLPFVTVFH